MPYELLEEAPVAPQDESTLGFLGRTGARGAARAGEAVLGLPGDIASGALNLANYGISKVTGKPGPIPELPLPTSGAIRRNITQPLTGEYLEPQGSGEEFFDEIIGDAATLLVPLKGKVPFGKAVGGALARSAAGNTAKWAAETVTDSPLVGAGAKIGAMALAGTLGGRQELNKLRGDSYKDAFAKIPEKAKFNFSPEKQELEKLAKTLTKGDRPDKAFMLDRFRSINNITNKAGKGSIEEAIQLKQDWNKHLADPSLPKASRDGLKQAVGILNEGIGRYGKTNPEFFKPYKIGEELTGALQSTNFVQKVLSKHPYLQDNVRNPIVQKLLWGGALYGAGRAGVPAIAGIGAAAIGAKEAAKTYQLISRSPVAQRYYKDAVQSALKNDIKSLGRNLSKLDKAADDYMSKHPDFDFIGSEEPAGRYQFVD